MAIGIFEKIYKIPEETSEEKPAPGAIVQIYCVMAAPFVGGVFLLLLPGRYGILGCLTTLAAAPLLLLSFPKKRTGKIMLFLLSAAYLTIGITVFIAAGNNT